jgi:citrate lyase subunit beta/citryl-CoA lyase
MALFVRVNPLDDWAGAEELRAVVRPGLAGVVLPKVRSAQEVRLADRLLGWCEQEQGLPRGGVALVPLLETARGLREAYDIARAASRIAYLGALTAPGGDVERSLGYEGMMAIHPSHVPVINEVFSPGPDELARCAELIAAVEAAQREGTGAVTFEGEMVDEAMARTARLVLARHGAEARVARTSSASKPPRRSR